MPIREEIIFAISSCIISLEEISEEGEGELKGDWRLDLTCLSLSAGFDVSVCLSFFLPCRDFCPSVKDFQGCRSDTFVCHLHPPNPPHRPGLPPGWKDQEGEREEGERKRWHSSNVVFFLCDKYQLSSKWTHWKRALNPQIMFVVLISPCSQCHRVYLLCVFSPEEEVVSSQSGYRRTERGSWRSGSGGWTEKRHCALLWQDRLRSRSVHCSSAVSFHSAPYTVYCSSIGLLATVDTVEAAEFSKILSVWLDIFDF